MTAILTATFPPPTVKIKVGGLLGADPPMYALAMRSATGGEEGAGEEESRRRPQRKAIQQPKAAG